MATLYVETTGSDSNDGTSVATALASWAGVLGILKAKKITRPITVEFGIGNFAGISVENFQFDPITPSEGANLLVKGTLINATVATGSATGTATSAASGTFGSTNTFATLTNSGASWTTNDLRGKLLEITAGTGVGQIVPIVSNTATAITVALASWVGVPSTSTYAIRDWGTVINSTIQQQPPIGSASVNNALAFVANNSAIARNFAMIRFQDLKFSAASGLTTAGVYVQSSPARFSMVRCGVFVTQSSVSGVMAMGKGTFDMTGCVVDAGSTTAGTSLSLQNGTFNQSPGATLTNCMFRGSGTGATGVSSVCYTDMTVSGCDFSNVTAMSVAAGAHTVFSSRITGSTAAYSLGGSLGGGVSTLTNCDLTSAGVAVNVAGLHVCSLGSVCTGSGSGTALKATEGGRIKLSSGSTTTGTIEIQLDATTETIANMRAASPKLIVNTHGSIVYQ